VDAMASARHTHSFLGIDQNGMCSIVRTSGNPDVHVVLRGGGGAANYSAEHIQATKQLLAATNGERRILVDCSHGNSNKDHRNQPGVFDNVLNQYLEGEQGILG